MVSAASGGLLCHSGLQDCRAGRVERAGGRVGDGLEHASAGRSPGGQIKTEQASKDSLLARGVFGKNVAQTPRRGVGPPVGLCACVGVRAPKAFRSKRYASCHE